MLEKIAKIRRLNDMCRRNLNRDMVLLTPWVQRQSPTDQRVIFQKVSEYSNFTPNNDPYHEHDMGIFHHNNQKLFWKIDYYDQNMQLGSDDPSDASITNRVLTIMHCSEY